MENTLGLEEVVIHVNLQNSAFSDCAGAELARILRELADKVEYSHSELGDEISLRDINGNKVGNMVAISEIQPNTTIKVTFDED